MKGTEDLVQMNGCYVNYNGDGGRERKKEGDHDLKDQSGQLQDSTAVISGTSRL